MMRSLPKQLMTWKGMDLWHYFEIIDSLCIAIKGQIVVHPMLRLLLTMQKSLIEYARSCVYTTQFSCQLECMQPSSFKSRKDVVSNNTMVNSLVVFLFITHPMINGLKIKYYINSIDMDPLSCIVELLSCLSGAKSFANATFFRLCRASSFTPQIFTW